MGSRVAFLCRYGEDARGGDKEWEAVIESAMPVRGREGWGWCVTRARGGMLDSSRPWWLW